MFIDLSISRVGSMRLSISLINPSTDRNGAMVAAAKGIEGGGGRSGSRQFCYRACGRGWARATLLRHAGDRWDMRKMRRRRTEGGREGGRAMLRHWRTRGKRGKRRWRDRAGQVRAYIEVSVAVRKRERENMRAVVVVAAAAATTTTAAKATCAP